MRDFPYFHQGGKWLICFVEIKKSSYMKTAVIHENGNFDYM